MTPRWRIGIALVALLAAGALFVREHGAPGYSVARLTLIVTVGLVLVGAGLVASVEGQRSTGVLLVLAGTAWLLERLFQVLPNALVATTGALLTGLWAAILVHAIITFPAGRTRSRVEAAVVGGGYFAAFGMNIPWFFVLPDFGSIDQRNVLLVHADQELADRIVEVADWLTAAWLAATLVVVVARAVRATPAARRTYGPVWVASTVFVANLGLLVLTVLGAYAYRDAYGLWLEIVAALVPLTLAATLFAARIAEDRLVALVADLESGGTTAKLRDALRRSLGDPTLDVVYPGVGGGGWVDGLGHPNAASATGRVLTPIEREGRAVAGLVHDRALLQRPDRLRAAASAANLALDSLQLKAALRAQLVEVQASRARIVEAGERERRRVERDIHDGAQQRLVGLALTLRLASRRAEGDPAVTDLLDEAAGELDDAIRELRELARGLHPALVDETGLEGAIEALGERPGVPVALDLDVPPGLPKLIEVGAYYLVAEALTNTNKHAGASQATVRAEVVDDALLVVVHDDGAGGATASPRSGLEGLADRISALGGELLVDSPVGGGTTVSAAIPLAQPSVSDGERRRLAALRWMGWENWEAPGELYDQITDEDNLSAAKVILLCAGGNASLTTGEREWYVGYLTAAGVADWVIEAVAAYDDADRLDVLIRLPRLANILSGLLYESLRICASDGPLTPDEVDRLQRAAATMDLSPGFLAELQDMVAAESRLRNRRYEMITVPVLAGIPARALPLS